MNPRIAIPICVAVATLFLGSWADAQDSPSPSSSPSPKSTPFQLPDMSKLYSQMFTESLRPERAAKAAHFQKLYYDALVKEGFTKDEALRIVIGTPSLAGKP